MPWSDPFLGRSTRPALTGSIFQNLLLIVYFSLEVKPCCPAQPFPKLDFGCMVQAQTAQEERQMRELAEQLSTEADAERSTLQVCSHHSQARSSQKQ